jgi:hypothetical protein
VKTITGRPAEGWMAIEHGSPALRLQRHAPCQDAAGLLAWDGPDRIPLPPTREVAHKDVAPDPDAKLAAAADMAKAAAKNKEQDAKAAPAKPKHRHLQMSER